MYATNDLSSYTMIWRTVSIIVLLLLLRNAVKYFLFRQQARALVIESEQWPTTYDVGSPSSAGSPVRPPSPRLWRAGDPGEEGEAGAPRLVPRSLKSEVGSPEGWSGAGFGGVSPVDQVPRASVDGAPPGRSALTYVVLGDSTALGTGASRREGSYAYRVADALASERFVHVVNLAVVGARIADVVTQQVPQLSLLKPDVISVSVGANDAAHATPYSAYRRSLDALARALQESSASVVLFANTPNMSYVPSFPVLVRQWVGNRAAKQNALLLGVLAGDAAKIRLVDLYEKGRLDAKENPAYYARDQYHPADAGYEVWARIFADTAGGIRAPRSFEGGMSE